MPSKSPFANLDLPRTHILTYLFASGSGPSNEPIWIDSRDPTHNLSPKQLLEMVRRMAAGFKKSGIEPRDVVTIFTPNHIYVPVIYLAIVGYGAVFTGLNPSYTVQELVHTMVDSEAKAMFVHPALLKTARAAVSQAGLSDRKLFLFSDSAREVPAVDGVRDWRTLMGSAVEGEAWKWDAYRAEEARNRIATINYSSGTTGLPKGVMVSHSSIIANVEQTTFIRYHLTPLPRAPERWVGFLPLYHAYGQLYTILMACKLQVPVYIMESFHYERFLGVIQKFRITNLQTAPPILVMLSKRPETMNYDLSSVREIVCGAAPVPLELQKGIAQRFGLKFTLGWGMTELTCTGMSIPGGMIEGTGSVGYLLPNSEVKLVDDEGREVCDGERGEIYIKGPNACLGYWKNPSATMDLFDEDGWLKTGDIAIRNGEGLFWIVDRKKELIKVNALQVAPAELEAKLLENERVADAAVVGITLNGNEWPRAYVVLREEFVGKVTDADIIEWMKDRVAKHKWLQGGVVFVDEIPKLASGKIQRKIMRQWAQRDADRIGREQTHKIAAKL